MTAAWSYFWPAIAVGLVIGVIAGLLAERRSRRNVFKFGGIALALAAAGLWHGPLGGARAFAATVERTVTQTLEYYEMTQVDARLGREPLSRQLHLRGPADDFQRGELVRVLNYVPGVRSVTWSDGQRTIPLLVEGLLAALGGYALGLLMAYLVALHRRYNAQWEW